MRSWGSAELERRETRHSRCRTTNEKRYARRTAPPMTACRLSSIPTLASPKSVSLTCPSAPVKHGSDASMSHDHKSMYPSLYSTVPCPSYRYIPLLQLNPRIDASHRLISLVWIHSMLIPRIDVSHSISLTANGPHPRRHSHSRILSGFKSR